jgi:hypothetical protein
LSKVWASGLRPRIARARDARNYLKALKKKRGCGMRMDALRQASNGRMWNVILT